VPAILVLDLGEALALHRFGEHDGRVTSVPGRCQRLVDLGDVVSVDGDGGAAEGLGTPLVGGHVPFQLGGATLAEPVHVDDRGEVAELVVGGLVQRLPH
jgi:hypothetical protein